MPSDILPMKDVPVMVNGQGCALMQVGVSRVVLKNTYLVWRFTVGRMHLLKYDCHSNGQEKHHQILDTFIKEIMAVVMNVTI